MKLLFMTHRGYVMFAIKFHSNKQILIGHNEKMIWLPWSTNTKGNTTTIVSFHLAEEKIPFGHYIILLKN